MILTPAQSEIAKDIHRYRVVNCGRRFGKTTLAVLEMVAKAISKKDLKIAYIAPTYQQARDIAWQDLIRVVQPVASKINETRLEIVLATQDGGESQIILRGWESVETLRGQKFDFLVIDEIASMRNFWINWEEVIRPTLTDTRGDVLFISTPKGFNHFYDLFNRGLVDKDFKSFHYTSYDNPHLPVEELEKAKQEMPEDRFAQEYLADFRKTSGLVYKEFDRKIHIKRIPEERLSVEKIAGVDFGFTNPTAILTIKKDYDGTYWVKDEFYKSGYTDTQVAEVVAGRSYNKVYPDPENPAAIKELKARKINVREVVKGKDSIKNGINKVREILKANRLFIDPSCTNLINELETYSYPDKKDQKNEDELPVKEHDHALDALRYVIMMQEAGEKFGPSSRQHIPRNLFRGPQYKIIE